MRGLIDGKYRITRALGRGGMAEVFAAEHVTLGTSFALKFAQPEVASDPELSKRFLNEARTAARIKSEHVARVTDLGTFDGRPYMVMELLEGEDLETLASRYQRLPIAEAVDYVVQALAGLHEVHSVGIVHRDLKPSNLFIHRPNGKLPIVKLVDFGVSKAHFGTSSKITTTGNVLGSPAYMSPEQLRSAKHVDARADIWSCGIILYELLTGTMPFHGENVGAVFAAILETEVAPPADVPAALADVILRCLRKSADERWPSALDLAIALASFASEDGRNVVASMVGPISARPSRVSMPEIRYVERRAAIVETISTAPPATNTVPPFDDSMATRSGRMRRRIFAVATGLAIAGILSGAAVWRYRTASAPAALQSAVVTPPSVIPTAVTATETATATAMAAATAPATAPAAVSASASAAASASASVAAPAPVRKKTKPRDDDAVFGRH
jgi:serine/threonine-protein kinase